VQQFITPIVVARKGKEKIAFFTVPEYVKWKDANNGGKGWNVRYYKVRSWNDVFCLLC
jgi:DNA topoisomerase-2